MSRTIAAVASLAFFSLFAREASAAPVLTGAIQFSTDVNGAAGTEFWNTRGGDGVYNLYLTNPATGIGGAFMNTGDGAPTSISLALTPGTTEIFLFGAIGADPTPSFYGLNLFFDGDNINPRISVLAAVDQSPSPPYPSFSPNGNASTRQLAGFAALVPGANTLTYSTGGTTVTVSDYFFSHPIVNVIDRVSAFGDVIDGRPDFIGKVTLVVSGGATSVPEPSTLVLWIAGSGALVIGRRSRRKTQGAG